MGGAFLYLYIWILAMLIGALALGYVVLAYIMVAFAIKSWKERRGFGESGSGAVDGKPGSEENGASS